MNGQNILGELLRTPLRRSSKNDPFLEVRRTRKKSQDLKLRLFHRYSLDWPALSRKRYRTLQEKIPDSPGRNTGLSRKKCRTLQEEIPDSPGRNTGPSRKKYRTLQGEIPDPPGRNTVLSREYALEFSCKP